jgi:hypothetical protein
VDIVELRWAIRIAAFMELLVLWRTTTFEEESERFATRNKMSLEPSIFGAWIAISTNANYSKSVPFNDFFIRKRMRKTIKIKNNNKNKIKIKK